MDSIKKYIIGGLVAIFLLLSFYGGYKFHAYSKPCPEIVTDTIVIHDTVLHYIPDTIPYYIIKTDSVEIRDSMWMDSLITAYKIDTTKILYDYYLKHYYNRTWNDSLVNITLDDVVAQNKIIDAILNYKILRPQTVINNIVNNGINYSKYVYIGLESDFSDYDYWDINVLYANDKFYAKFGYMPKRKGITVGAGIKLFKLK